MLLRIRSVRAAVTLFCPHRKRERPPTAFSFFKNQTARLSAIILIPRHPAKSNGDAKNFAQRRGCGGTGRVSSPCPPLDFSIPHSRYGRQAQNQWTWRISWSLPLGLAHAEERGNWIGFGHGELSHRVVPDQRGQVYPNAVGQVGALLNGIAQGVKGLETQLQIRAD